MEKIVVIVFMLVFACLIFWVSITHPSNKVQLGVVVLIFILLMIFQYITFKLNK